MKFKQKSSRKIIFLTFNSRTQNNFFLLLLLFFSLFSFEAWMKFDVKQICTHDDSSCEIKYFDMFLQLEGK